MRQAASSIRAVVFDYGNVLMMVDRPAQCRQLARHSPLSAEEILRRIWDNDLEREAESGRYDSREQFRRIRQRIQAEEGWSYEEFLEDFAAGFEPNPEGLEALRRAAAGGRRTFILSNTSYPHARRLFLQEELATIPEGYVFSFKVGAMKPAPAIWRHLLATTGLEAGQCAYIDDVPEYCRAAEALGFAAIHYEKGRTDLLRCLADLL
jgi:HAD superfamily hydrolase (TIGR01509 family)